MGTITVHDPFTGQPRPYKMPAGGRGYTRPASLVSVWSTAPFLLNNSLGEFKWSPSVEARMASFQDSIEKLLWPERREKDTVLGDKVPGWIDRTTAPSYLRVAAGYLPEALQPLLGRLNRHLPWAFGEGGVEIGPIPKGTPVNLMANLEMMPDGADLSERAAHVKKLLPAAARPGPALKKVDRAASDEEVRKAFAPLVPQLLELTKCPDFVVNRGHYFGTSAFKEEPGTERRGQARLDRVPEDLLGTGGSRMAPDAAAAGRLRVRRGRARARAGGRWPPAWPRRATVVLLEAGGDPRHLVGGDPVDPGGQRLPEDYDVPAFHAFASENDGAWRGTSSSGTTRATPASTRTRSTGRRGTTGSSTACFYPRAGTLGGCTAHNALIFVLPTTPTGTASPRSPGTPPGAPRACAGTSGGWRTAITGRCTAGSRSWASTPRAMASRVALAPSGRTSGPRSAIARCGRS